MQTFDPRSLMLNSDDLVARRCVPGQLSPLTGLMLTLWVVCGVVFLSWCLSSQSQMEQSVEPATKFPEKSVASTAAVQELPPVEIGKSAIFPLAGLRTLLISFVIMGHQGYMSNSKLMWRYMHGSMTFFIAASGFLKFKSANGVSDWVKFRRYTANTLLRFWPTYFVALLLTLLLMAQVQGSVSIGFPLDAMFIQAFLLLDVCDMVGGNNFLPFQALLVGWFVSVIMWCTLFAPVVVPLAASQWPSSVGFIRALRCFARVPRDDGRVPQLENLRVCTCPLPPVCSWDGLRRFCWTVAVQGATLGRVGLDLRRRPALGFLLVP